MADLKPLGSEKLQGKNKIDRILEIANYRHTQPTVNENKSKTADYSIQLSDGNFYGIVHEKNGYIVKKGINESDLDYIEPMKNRKYYKSYSQAMKKINLIAGELNRIYEHTENIDLIGEQKKFVLKTPKPETPSKSEDELSLDMETPKGEEKLDIDIPKGEDDLDLGLDGLEGDEDLGLDDLEGDEDLDLDMDIPEDEEDSSFKSIQKLTGKLGQKLRDYDKKQSLNSEDIKYVLNSIISAVDLNKLSEEDMEDIVANFEEEDIDYGMEGEVDIDVKAGDEDFDLDLDMSDEESEGEMAENVSDYFLSIDDEHGWYDSNDRKYDGNFDFDFDEEEIHSYDDLMDKRFDQKWFAPRRSDDTERSMTNDGRRMFDLYKDKYKKPFKLRKRRHEDKESNQTGNRIMDEIFSESKVDKVLSKYFVITEEEKQITENKKIKNFIIEKINKSSIKNEIKRLSETIDQELASELLINENKNIKFLGKTNKNNLVFELNNKQFKVSPNGELL